MQEEDEVRLAMQRIRAIVRRSARADTVEGVHAFWIQWPEPRPPIELTKQALERLELAGEVERVTLEDKRQVWRGARKRRRKD